MFKVKILTIGKVKDKWLSEALCEYEKRLSKILCFSWIFAKTDTQLEKWVEKETYYLCMDPKGTEFTSEEFSKEFFSLLEKRGSYLTLVIGGSEGISAQILGKANHIFSLSKLTFTHQITRLILLEQIYRAAEIKAGSNYHK